MLDQFDVLQKNLGDHDGPPLQCEQRASGPEGHILVGDAGFGCLPGQGMTGWNAPILKFSTKNSRVTEKRFSQRPAAQPGDPRPWPAQRSKAYHAVRKYDGDAIAFKNDFADIGQTINMKL